jgi:alpha-glucosidase
MANSISHMKSIIARNLTCLAALVAAATLSSCSTQNPPAATGSATTSSAAKTSAPAASAPAAPMAAKAPTKVMLHFVRADSEETAGEDAKGANAVDGNPNTFWHTQWQDENPPCPHEIVIEVMPTATIKGFTYLPRQDEEVNGTINEFEFYVSKDGKDFGTPVKKGTFDGSKNKQTVTFAPVECHFFKLRAISELNGGAWTSAAEIGVVLQGASN